MWLLSGDKKRLVKVSNVEFEIRLCDIIVDDQYVMFAGETASAAEEEFERLIQWIKDHPDEMFEFEK